MPKKAERGVPRGMNTVTTHLWFDGTCAEALEFYQKAFGAEVVGDVARGPSGKGVMHAMMRLGDSNIMMADAWPGMWERPPRGDTGTTVGMFLFVDDCDALFERAKKAGCEVVSEMMDAFWGDRMGKVKDPFGHAWAIATRKWDLTPEEIENGQQQWLASLQQSH